MNRSMIVAANTMSQLQQKMDVISNNIANVQTNGYKRREASFTELLAQQFNNQPHDELEVGRNTPNGIRQGVGAGVAQSQMVMSQGNMITTGRELDVAFTTEGQYLTVLVPGENTDEIQYTRDGSLYWSPLNDTQVMLVTSEGNPVLDENEAPIVVNGTPTEVSVSPTGQIRVTTENGDQAWNLGVIQINRPQALVQQGGNRIALPDNLAELGVELEEILTPMNGALRENIAMQQGALEQSNVDLSVEMTDLIQAQRSYQFQSRAISLSDQMMGLINGIR
ncbi:flagellar basal-body rod protein FlgG [Bacillus oleivorans]|uniref:Flagellar basal-body rod protein FlgG n=1 Tax=Bacillus oleivorans TaxID=1448271 RepID=A0A285CHF4_9BACI|nr:flagellar hook-basal body protein [Bacillus oleivorans]SNX67024.1 flagellar basal-body rod protein FlgG [Bacillus oleivorans]